MRSRIREGYSSGEMENYAGEEAVNADVQRILGEDHVACMNSLFKLIRIEVGVL